MAGNTTRSGNRTVPLHLRPFGFSRDPQEWDRLFVRTSIGQISARIDPMREESVFQAATRPDFVPTGQVSRTERSRESRGQAARRSGRGTSFDDLRDLTRDMKEKDVRALSSLPLECILLVLGRLEVKDLCTVAAVDRAHRSLVRDSDLWKSLAEQKWGKAVLELSGDLPAGWEGYCKQRMSFRSIVRSPFGLLQENYGDPWQHLLCCLLCSRTSGSSTIAACVALTVDTFPTPTKMLDATEAHWTSHLVQDCPLCELIHPLGLQVQRCKAVRGMTLGFLRSDWEDPIELYGVGKFTADSWAIFCRGKKDLNNVEDLNLKKYLRWLRGETSPPVQVRTTVNHERSRRKRKRETEAVPRRSRRIMTKEEGNGVFAK